MEHDRLAQKRPINVSFNEELVQQARLFTRNLSGTPETLLRGHVQHERAQRLAEDAAVDQVIDAMDAFHLEHGLLSDEFSAL